MMNATRLSLFIAVLALLVTACAPVASSAPLTPLAPAASLAPAESLATVTPPETPPETLPITGPSPTTSPTLSPSPTLTATSDDPWVVLHGHTPVLWTTPLPPLEATVLDATYVKINPREATPFPCKRCPDYALEGGLWKLSLREGIFRIYYTMNGWRSLGSYTVSGDHLYLFNDPYCNWDVGEYTWKLEEGALVLVEVDDPCSQGLRAANLTDQPWLSCEPPNVEAKITDHWPKPEGCDPDGG